MSNMNRLANAKNDYQGDAKKVLCVCSAGLLRSPTAAWVLSNDPWNFNTRAVGHAVDFALVPLDPVLIHWSDEIVVMSGEQAQAVNRWNQPNPKPVHRLDVPDNYPFRHPELVAALKEKFLTIWPQ